jgi:hypothetical protein
MTYFWKLFMPQSIAHIGRFTAWHLATDSFFSHCFYLVFFARIHFLLLYSIQQAIEELALSHAPIPQHCFLAQRGKAGQLNIQICLLTFFTP